MTFVRGLAIAVLAVLVSLFSEVRVTTGQCNHDEKVIDLAHSPLNGPIYVLNYTYSHDQVTKSCRWKIEAPFGQKVLIYFTAFDLGIDSCRVAKVEISEGSETLAEGCGSTSPPLIISSGDYLAMSFFSVWHAIGGGFVAHFKAINSSSGCDGLLKYIDLRYKQNGTIYSPNYPSSYGGNEHCNWRIRTSRHFLSKTKLLIYFTSFDLGTDCCSCDYVEIYDGPSDHYKLLARFCGNSLPPPVYSSDRYIYVKFRSNSTIQGRGFVAHYKELFDYSGCTSINPEASAGVIYNNHFPFDYGGRKCIWWIIAPSGMMINLTFTKFDLSSNWPEFAGFCDNYVEVNSNLYRRKLCGSLAPFSMYFSGSISVTFEAGYSGTGGFLAFYQIRAGSVPTTPYRLQRLDHYTLQPTFVTPASLSDACRPYSQNRVDLGSSSSLSIASPIYRSSPDLITTCSWEIITTKGYILQLTIDSMTISSCGETCCAYEYVQARDGNELSDPLLGTYCSGNYPSVVSSKGNQMFIKYYGRYSNDTFQATVRPKKADQSVGVVVIVVPIVVAVVIIVIVVAVIVIKRRRRRSSGTARSTSANEVPQEPLPQSTELAPLFSEQAPSSLATQGSVQL